MKRTLCLNSSLVNARSTLGNAKVYGYDLPGRKTYEGGATCPVRYTYDAYGRPTGYLLSASATPRKVDYAYDALGHLVAVEFDSQAEAQSGRVECCYLPGTDLVSDYTSGEFSRAVSYEPHRDLIAAVTNSFGTSLISAFDYANDAAGRRVSRIDTFDRVTTTNTFGYNVRSEVISATMGTNTYGYAYDPIGNRLNSTHNDTASIYTANALNQHTAIDGAEPTYDADGNMTADGNGWHYDWNGENRMICASNADVIVTYAYDHRGRMARKEILHGVVGTQRLEYVWDNWNVVRETKLTNDFAQLTYNIWGLDLNGSIQGTCGVGGLLSVCRNAHNYYPIYDANGNVFEYVNASNGTLVAHYDYSPFGEPIVMSGAESSSFSYWFSTKPYCLITKLAEYQIRKYKSKIGRWISRDPIEDSSGHDSLFVENRPIGGIDIAGLSFCVPWGPPEVIERKTKILVQGARHAQYKLRSYRIAIAPGTTPAPVIIPPYRGVIVQKSICVCVCERQVLSYEISIECERKQQRIHCEFNEGCGTVSGDVYEDLGWSSRFVKRREPLGGTSTITKLASPLQFSETDDRSCELPCFSKCNALNSPEPSFIWNGSCESL